jgi:hypothetical protein
MTKENQAKWEQACEALKLMGLTPKDFVELGMAMCLHTWAEDDPTPMTVSDAMDIRIDTGYFEHTIARALKL